MSNEETDKTRREFLHRSVRGACLLAIGGGIGFLASRSQADDNVWQIDPTKCVSCGKCATHCVLDISAVKCLHDHAVCGYCQLCTGYFNFEPNALNTAAENQLCPTGAIKRRYVEDPYFEYVIEESLCIGCAKCVLGCTTFGNGSLFLQVRHDLCVNCNDCAIARECPSDAFKRVPADQPHLLKKA
ncbi:MAG: ferredoxin [Candidatus Latescibacteria bacterium]|jgi:Na+-translocating ferredoxin:NAD+ oxidoreductase subunit B|nr:ferredoxin [Candidatus Latescibacterota bacterium]